MGVALLLVAYALLGSLAAEPLLRWAATRWLADHGGHRLVLRQVQWQPWQLALTLRGVSLQTPDGAPLLELDRLLVDVELASLWQRAVVLADLQLDKPVLHWRTRADGRSNWGDFIRAATGPAPAAPDDSGPLRVWLQQVRLRDGGLHLQDASVPGGITTRLDALTWDAQDLSTLPGRQGRHTLAVRSEIGATLRGTGTLTLHPVAAGGTLALESLALDRLAPLLAPWVDTNPLRGQAAATVAYQLSSTGGRTALKLSDVHVQGTALGWQDRSADPPVTATAQQLTVRLGADLAMGSGPLALRIDGVGVQLAGLQVAGDGQPQPWLDLATVDIAGGRFDGPARQLDLGRVSLAQGRVQVRRDAQGALALMQAVQGRLSPAAAPAGAAPPPAAAAPAAPAPAWRWRVGPSRLSGITLAWQDESVRPAASLAVTAVEGELGALSDDPSATADARLQLQVASGGQLELRGPVMPAKAAATLDLRVDGLQLAPASPYLAQSTALALADGRLDLKGQLQGDGGQWRYRGGFDLQRLRLVERATRERLLSWHSLSSDSVEADLQRLRIGELALSGLGGRFTVFADGSTNVARVLQRPATQPQPAARASDRASDRSSDRAPAGSGGYGVAVDRIKVSGGTVEFADLSLALPFGARIEDLGGQIVGGSTAPGTQAQLALEGRVAPAGLARLSGRLRTADPLADTDLKLLFRNVEMTALTPYAATFAGRRIASGTLSLDLQYRLEPGRLRGDNQVVMDRLVLGDKVGAPDALDLPLDLAIALLQDANGRIELGLPVSGSLEDPQFALGPLVWKALSNVLVKAATAPFQALAALVGGSDGPPLDRIDFDPGRADLTPPERQKLDRLAQALQQRAGLVLTVQAPFDPSADGAALREQALRRAVAQASGRSLADGEDPGPIEPSQPATLAALQRLYLSRIGPALPGDGQDLLQRLRESEALPDTALQALARRRAESIRDALTAQGVAASGVRLAPPAPTASAGGTPGATLGLERLAAAPAGR